MGFLGTNVPDPKIVISNSKLVASYGGAPMDVQKQSSSDATSIAFDVNGNLDVSALQTYLTGETNGRVLRWRNQASVFGDGVKSSDITIKPPIIHWDSAYRINNVPVAMFEGGSHGGEVWGLDLEPPLQPHSINGRNWTAMLVVRPTSSIFRNQNHTPDIGEGTFLSLEATVPFAASGNTTIGSTTITNVTPIAGIVPGMSVSGPAFPFGDSFVVTVEVTGPDVGTVTLFGAGAVATFTPVTILFSTPLARMYADGDGASGSLAISDGNAVSFKPTDFSGLEIGPSVLTFQSNFSDALLNTIGMKSYMNDLIQSSNQVSGRSLEVNTGFIGRWGGSMAVAPPFGGLSKSGDFWCLAIVVWNVALSHAQMAIARDALYRRFDIKMRRSIRSAKSVTFLGDSIVSGYNASKGLYGMVPRLQDMLPATTRVMNYSVPGSQITPNVGSPLYASTEGLFEAGVRRNMKYNTASKNALVILGGVNDMIWNETFTCTFTNASPGQVIGTPPNDAWAVDQRVTFSAGSGTLPALITAGVFYWVKTVVNSTTINISATPGGAAINFTGSSGTCNITIWPKTAASIFAGIDRIVDSATLAGVNKIWVCTVLRRTGDAYDFILDALNTLIRANDGTGGYTVIDLEADATLNNNDSPPNVAGPAFPDGTHPNDVGHQAAANALFTPINAWLAL